MIFLMISAGNHIVAKVKLDMTELIGYILQEDYKKS